MNIHSHNRLLDNRLISKKKKKNMNSYTSSSSSSLTSSPPGPRAAASTYKARQVQALELDLDGNLDLNCSQLASIKSTLVPSSATREEVIGVSQTQATTAASTTYTASYHTADTNSVLSAITPSMGNIPSRHPSAFPPTLDSSIDDKLATYNEKVKEIETINGMKKPKKSFETSSYRRQSSIAFFNGVAELVEDARIPDCEGNEKSEYTLSKWASLNALLQSQNQPLSEKFNLTNSLYSPGDIAIIQELEDQRILANEKRATDLGVDMRAVLKSKDQYVDKYPFKQQLLLFIIFCLWQIAIFALLCYRTWGMYVGYSQKWHWNNIHQDLRMDDKMWKAYIGSLIFFDLVFFCETRFCLVLGEIYWRDLLCLGLFRGVELFYKLMNRIKGRQYRCRGKIFDTEEFWDWDWELEMVSRYRRRIWRWIGCVFMVLPVTLLLAYCWVFAQPKCYFHQNDIGFGY